MHRMADKTKIKDLFFLAEIREIQQTGQQSRLSKFDTVGMKRTSSVV